MAVQQRERDFWSESTNANTAKRASERELHAVDRILGIQSPSVTTRELKSEGVASPLCVRV